MPDVSRAPVIALALAGGGPEGAIYEIGALRALDEALVGLRLNDLPLYVGVSAGAFVSALLANGLSTAQLCRSVVAHEPGEQPFEPELFLMPAIGEFVQRSLRVPGLPFDAMREVVQNPRNSGIVSTFAAHLAQAVPAGLFANEPLRVFLERVFQKAGRTNDFRRLDRRLYIVATDLDSGEAVRFGEAGWDTTPIATAVQASTALPGLYPPVRIDGRYYVDGVLLKTLHASVALEKGADLVLCLNPIVPVDTDGAHAAGMTQPGKLVERGMPAVLSQTLRTIVHSRLSVGMAAYEERFPDADVLLFEPRRDDYRMFFTNIFSFQDRKDVCEHAYRSTLRTLAERRDELAPVLARHGLALRDEVLDMPDRNLWDHVGLDERPVGTTHTSPVTQSLRIVLHKLERRLSGTTA